MKTFATSKPDQPMALAQAVWVDPARMSGAPCFRGTRLPVQQLFDWLSDGVLQAGSARVCADAANNPNCASRT